MHVSRVLSCPKPVPCRSKTKAGVYHKRSMGWRTRANSNIEQDDEEAKKSVNAPIRSVADRILFGAAEFLGIAVGQSGGISNAVKSVDPLSPEEVRSKLLNLFEQSYFFVGRGNDEDWSVFDVDCLFMDEFSSFKKTSRFRRNVENFGKFLENPQCKVLKVSEDCKENVIAIEWAFSARVKGINGLLAARGSTTYTLGDVDGRVVKHDERWKTTKREVLANMLFKRT
eukprot:jgi/Picsp_1/643/NSC_00639-R1_protein